MKTIDTLIEDIYEVVQKRGGWTAALTTNLSESLAKTIERRLTPAEGERSTGTLRMSNIGQPCVRKLWYHCRDDHEGEEIRASALLNFLNGDIWEDIIINLAIAAGHKVEGVQDELTYLGIKGHRDAIIDGVQVDLKSASKYSFQKFKNNALREDDPFGYITQQTGYLKASQDDPRIIDKKRIAFLVIEKQTGAMCLDQYEVSEELEGLEKLYTERKNTVNSPTLPERGFEDEPEGKSGNRKLGVNCSYCDYRNTCWPGLRTFVYHNGPVFLTEVVKEPRVPEVT